MKRRLRKGKQREGGRKEKERGKGRMKKRRSEEWEKEG